MPWASDCAYHSTETRLVGAVHLQPTAEKRNVHPGSICHHPMAGIPVRSTCADLLLVNVELQRWCVRVYVCEVGVNGERKGEFIYAERMDAGIS